MCSFFSKTFSWVHCCNLYFLIKLVFLEPLLPYASTVIFPSWSIDYSASECREQVPTLFLMVLMPIQHIFIIYHWRCHNIFPRVKTGQREVMGIFIAFGIHASVNRESVFPTHQLSRVCDQNCMSKLLKRCYTRTNIVSKGKNMISTL